MKEKVARGQYGEGMKSMKSTGLQANFQQPPRWRLPLPSRHGGIDGPLSRPAAATLTALI